MIDQLHFLYQEHSLRLYRVIMKIVKDEEIAKDIVQDTFIEVGTNYSTLRDESKIVGWLYKIAVNQTISFIRNKKRFTLVPLEILETKKYANVNDPLNHMTEKELKAEIQASLDVLDARSLAVMTLFYYDEKTIKQISEILQIPAGTVKSRLHRAKSKLKLHINQHPIFWNKLYFLTREDGDIYTLDTENV